MYGAFTVYVAPWALGGGPSLAEGMGVRTMDDAARLRCASAERLGEGVLLTYARA
ncbi:MAG: hypothetical protein LC624_11040 [Halobacteriales archaeon]|nr:hypothetical protein [Halobacteriales archaeon]